MGKLSEKEFNTLLHLNQGVVPGIGLATEVVPNGVNEFVSQFRDVSTKDMLDSILPNPEEETDIMEELMLDEDNTRRLYTVVKDNKTGNIIKKTLKHEIDGIRLDDTKESKNLLDIIYRRNELFEHLHKDLSTEGEFSKDIGKSWFDNAWENSLTYQAMTLVGKVATGDKSFGRYGAGFFAGKTEDFTYLNKLQIKEDGLYYDNMKLSSDPKELDMLQNYLGKKLTYTPDGFLDQFANIATSFVIDFPLFKGAGAISSKLLGTALPSVVNSANIPGRLAKHFVSTGAMLGFAEAPAIVNHTMEGGINAFGEDMQHLAKFSLYASAFGIAGEYAGLGASKLLQRGRNLQMEEAVQFLRRNPKVVNTLTTGMTAGMLGYAVTNGTTEEKLATGLTFASLHFASKDAWKGYLNGKEKSVMVENDLSTEIKKKMDSGLSYKQAVKETGATTPRYYFRKDNNLYEMHSGKFTNYGEIEYAQDSPIQLTTDNVKGYKYITETFPFVTKTMRQAWNDEELRLVNKKVREEYFKNVKNPYPKETDDYKSFEINKEMTAAHIANMIYGEGIRTELKRNSLPNNSKLNGYINKTSTYFGLEPKVFERHISKRIVDHLKNNPELKAEFEFLPEEYSKQFQSGLGQAEKAFYNAVAQHEVNMKLGALGLIQDSRNMELDQQEFGEVQRVTQEVLSRNAESIRKRPIEIKEPPKKPSETLPKGEVKTEIPIVETKPKAGESELVDEFGNPLTKKLSWRDQYERDRQQGKIIPIEGKQPVDKYDLNQIKTLNDLNKALEEVDSPTTLLDRMKEEGKSELTKKSIKITPEIEQQLKAMGKSFIEQWEKDVQFMVARHKLDYIVTDKFAKERMSPEELKDYRQAIRELVVDRGDVEANKKLVKDLSKKVLNEYRLSSDYEADKMKQEIEKSAVNAETRQVLLDEYNKAKVTPFEEVTTREKAVEESKGRTAKLERDLLNAQEQLRKAGLSEERIQQETYENPESEPAKIVAQLMEESVNRHRIDVLKETTPTQIKAVKLETGEVISFKGAKSHIGEEFAKLPKEVINKIVDTGFVNERGEFTSTRSVPVEAYQQALKNIKQNLGLKSSLLFGAENLKDWATIGAYHFENGLRSFANWSRKMIQEFTTRVKPYLSRLWQITSQYLSGERAFVDPGTLGLFGGGSATEFNRKKAEGKIFEGKEGKEKFHIPDNKSKFKIDTLIMEGKPSGEYELSAGVNVETMKIGDTVPLSKVFTHLELYKQYPEAADIKFSLGNSKMMGATTYADYGNNEIRVNVDNLESNLNVRSDVIHEVQHWIQEQEGFTTGTPYHNINLAKSPIALDKVIANLKDNMENRFIGFDALRLGYQSSAAYAVGITRAIERVKAGELIDAGHYDAIQSEIYRLSAGELEAKAAELYAPYPEMPKGVTSKEAIDEYLVAEGLRTENLIHNEDYTVYTSRVEKEKERQSKIKEEEPEGKRTSVEGKEFAKAESLLGRYKPRRVSGKLKGTTLDPDTYARLHNIKTVTNLSEEDVNSYKERIGKDLTDLEDKRVKEEITYEQYEEAEDNAVEAFYNLNTFGNLEDKRGQELKDAVTQLREIVEEGRHRFKVTNEARKKRMSDLREMVKKSFGGFEPLSETESRLRGLDKKELNIKEQLSKGLSDAENTFLFGLNHILQKLSPKDYTTSRYIMENTKRAEGREADGLDKWEQTVQNKLREIYGKEGNDLLKTLTTNKDRVDKTGIMIGGKELPLSQNEAYKKWMEWQDEKYGRPTLEKMGFTEENVKQLEKFMSPQIKKWADWQLKELYPEYYKPVNEVYRRLYSVNLSQHENYSPLKRNVTRVQEDNLMKASLSPIASMINKSLLERTGSKAELQYVDGDQVLMAHIAQMEHFKAWAEHIKELRSILQHSGIKTIIKQNYGDKYNVLVDNYINDLARGSVTRDKVVPLIDKLRNNFTGAVLSIPKINLFPQQLSSMFFYAAKMPTADFISGFGEMLANPMEAYKTLFEGSANMRSRYKEGFERDIKDFMARKEVQKLAGVKSIKDALMYAIRMGDKFAVVAGGYPVYKYHYEKAIQEGLSPEAAKEKAIAKFDVATDETQQSSKLVDLSEMQRGGSWSKLFTMFQSQPNLYYRATSIAIRDLARGKGEPRQHIKTILLAHFALPMLFQFISDFGWNSKHQARAAILGSFNGIFIVGDILSNLVSALQNDFNFGIEGSPILDAPTQMLEGFKKIGKALDEGDISTEDVLITIDKFARATSKFVGIPYEPTKKVIAGVGVKLGKEGLEYSTENINIQRMLGVSEMAIKETEYAMKDAKKQMNIYEKRYKRTHDDDDREAYVEARKEYKRLVNELKQKERTKK